MARTRDTAVAVVTASLLMGWLTARTREVAAETVPSQAASSSASRGLAAIDQAAQANKYLYIFFWKNNDQQARNMFGVFQRAVGDMAGAVDSIGLQITDPREKVVVDRFGVSRAPMPLVLAVAPNGAVTKAWSVRFTEQQLPEGLVSPCTARCLKALQDRKLVLLCIGNQSTPLVQAAFRGVQDFKADARFAKATEVVVLDPGDRSEEPLLRELQVDPQSPQATTVVLAPPGQPIARFSGPVTKDQIAAKVTSAQSGCCPGGKCGPGGRCCPPQ